MGTAVRFEVSAVFVTLVGVSFALCIPAFGQDEGTPVEESFIKDGKVDVNAVVDHFENLYRADSSISEASAPLLIH